MKTNMKQGIMAAVLVGSFFALGACSSGGYSETHIGVRSYDHGYVSPRGDRDRDGIPNRFDHDRDGDGVPNRSDIAPNDPRL